MARNKYKGICYMCGKTVEVGEGHFFKYNGKWLLHHWYEAKGITGVNRPKPSKVLNSK